MDRIVGTQIRGIATQCQTDGDTNCILGRTCNHSNLFRFGNGHYAEGYGAHSKTLQPQSWDDYTQNAKILEEQRGYYRSDLIRMGFGLAVAGLSYRWAY